MSNTNDANDDLSTWQKKRRRGDLAPNPALWAALKEGEGLRDILTTFYERAFQDPRLSPFFEGVTIDRAIGKQYAFLREIITGQKVYWGERPRNAHHWMVITTELFDYREAKIEEVMREWGLADEHIKSWLAIHEVFRKQIVKDAPIPKKIRGVSMPLEGHEWVTLSAGTICDGCERAVEIDERVAYHVRTGKTYCTGCAPKELGASDPEGQAP